MTEPQAGTAPSTGAMMKDLDAALGGRAEVMRRVRELLAANPGEALSWPLNRLWKDHCRPRPEPPKPAEEQIGLFGAEELPAPAEPPPAPFKRIYVHFETPDDMRAFAALINQPVGMSTQAIFYPAGDLTRNMEDLARAGIERDVEPEA